MGFYESRGAEQRLKKVALCLRLTDVALAITAAKHENRQGREPTIVRLSRGDVQRAASTQVTTVLALLHTDVHLDVTDVLTGLLTTHGHLVVRFDDYAKWPFRMWTLCQRWNADSFVSAIEAFLDLAPAELDAGFCRPLQAEALKQGSLAQAISFLLADAIQFELEQTLEILSASSLDVERKHAQDKKQERNRVLSAGAASRNCLLQRYCTGRHAAIAANVQLRSAMSKKLKMSATALAAQHNPSWLPRPGGFMGSQFDHPGRPADLKQYVEANKVTLQAEAAAIRREASAALAVSDLPILPRTNADWLRFLETRRARFRELLRAATAQRRALSARRRVKNNSLQT